MGLFRPFDEEAKPIDHVVNLNAKYAAKYGRGAYGTGGKKAKDLSKGTFKRIMNQNPNDTSLMSAQKKAANYASGRKPVNASASLLGISDEEFYELSEGNCNSDTCKCKGGTCPVEVTDGISTSSYAAKKLASAGSNNKTDLNAVKPNAEYSRQNDALFIGDGDSPETSKTNIPAILAAKTAGGAPHGWTTDNGINGTSNNVFKLRKLRDDDDGPNG